MGGRGRTDLILWEEEEEKTALMLWEEEEEEIGMSSPKTQLPPLLSPDQKISIDQSIPLQGTGDPYRGRYTHIRARFPHAVGEHTVEVVGRTRQHTAARAGKKIQ